MNVIASMRKLISALAMTIHTMHIVMSIARRTLCILSLHMFMMRSYTASAEMGTTTDVGCSFRARTTEVDQATSMNLMNTAVSRMLIGGTWGWPFGATITDGLRCTGCHVTMVMIIVTALMVIPPEGDTDAMFLIIVTTMMDTQMVLLPEGWMDVMPSLTRLPCRGTICCPIFQGGPAEEPVRSILVIVAWA
jgi:hypothetical protein